MPPLEAFEAPIEQVLAENPEIGELFPSVSGGHQRVGMVRADVLRETWGEPSHWELSWWNLWPGNWPFAPQTLWSWPIGGGARTLRCRIDHPFYELFRATACDCRLLDSS